MPRLDQRLGLTRYEADEHYRLALKAFEKRDYDNAIDQMTKAIDAYAGNAEYFAARGLMYLDDGVEEKATEDFQAARKLFAYELLANYGLGVIAYKKEDWDSAHDYFTTAYYADQQRAETLYYLALVYFHKREFASAANLMRLAHARFEATQDKRKGDAQKWLNELKKLAEKTAQLLANNAHDT